MMVLSWYKLRFQHTSSSCWTYWLSSEAVLQEFISQNPIVGKLVEKFNLEVVE